MTSRELFSSLFKGITPERPPIWFMRQAGRYLPEYRKLREGKSFEDMVMNANIAKEITLQPIQRFNLDAAIIFSDILIPLYYMQRGLKIVPNQGPKLQKPLTNPIEISDILIPQPDEDFPYVVESLKLVREEISDKWLIGFAGGPFTLASYLIEGKSTRDALKTKKFAYLYPDAFDNLLDKLSDIIISQLNSQMSAGVDMVQIFESWALYLSPWQFQQWVSPHLKKIIQSLNGVPNSIYARGSSHLLPELVKLSFDVISIDSTLSLSNVRKNYSQDVILQGNLDPSVLQTNLDTVRKETQHVLEEGTKFGNKYIFNLAQGIHKDSDVNLVGEMVEIVKRWKNYD